MEHLPASEVISNSIRRWLCTCYSPMCWWLRCGRRSSPWFDQSLCAVIMFVCVAPSFISTGTSYTYWQPFWFVIVAALCCGETVSSRNGNPWHYHAACRLRVFRSVDDSLKDPSWTSLLNTTNGDRFQQNMEKWITYFGVCSSCAVPVFVMKSLFACCCLSVCVSTVSSMACQGLRNWIVTRKSLLNNFIVFTVWIE